MRWDCRLPTQKVSESRVLNCRQSDLDPMSVVVAGGPGLGTSCVQHLRAQCDPSVQNHVNGPHVSEKCHLGYPWLSSLWLDFLLGALRR